MSSDADAAAIVDEFYSMCVAYFDVSSQAMLADVSEQPYDRVLQFGSRRCVRSVARS